MEIDGGVVLLSMMSLVLYGSAYLFFRMFVLPNLRQFYEDWPDVHLAPKSESLMFGTGLLVDLVFIVIITYGVFTGKIGHLPIVMVFFIGLVSLLLVFALLSFVALFDYSGMDVS